MLKKIKFEWDWDKFEEKNYFQRQSWTKYM